MGYRLLVRLGETLRYKGSADKRLTSPLWLQIETIGKKVTSARIPYTPAIVGSRTTSTEPPTKKAKA